MGAGEPEQNRCCSQFQILRPCVGFLEEVVETSEVGEVGLAQGPRTSVIRPAVHRPRGDWNRRRLLRLDGVVLIHGEITVCAQVAGEDVPDPLGQRVRCQ